MTLFNIAWVAFRLRGNLKMTSCKFGYFLTLPSPQTSVTLEWLFRLHLYVRCHKIGYPLPLLAWRHLFTALNQLRSKVIVDFNFSKKFFFSSLNLNFVFDYSHVLDDNLTQKMRHNDAKNATKWQFLMNDDGLKSTFMAQKWLITFWWRTDP